MMPVITKTVSTPTLQARIQTWRGTAWRNLVMQAAQDMGDAARANIIKHGEPGGDWPKLQGYNAHKATGGKALKTLRPRAGSLYGREANQGRLAAMLDANKAARARQKARKARGESKGSVNHDGYARQKALGKTPGHGKFGPDVRLRDTGSLFEGMDGDVRWDGNGAVIRLVSRGGGRGRPPNNTLLQFHARGMGNNPVRNPGLDMGLYEKRTALALRQFLANAARAGESKESTT